MKAQVNVVKDAGLFAELTAKRETHREPSQRTIERQKFFALLDSMLEQDENKDVLQWVFDVTELNNAQRLTLKNRVASWAKRHGYNVDFYRVRKYNSRSYLPVQLERK